MTFEDLLTNDDLLDAVYDMHFEECTPIQEFSIPPVLEGRDLLAVAQTGTGKTAAYLLPIIERLINDNYPEDNINCVVMAPTRELALQIDRQMQGFSYYLPVSSMAIYGGTDGNTYDQQKKGLKKGADVIIATPGRLLSHLNMGYVDLSKTSFFVLDEADRMLDMGFLDDIMKIISHLPKERQTLMFSATMPPKIQQLASQILSNPVEVKIAVSKPADKINQGAFLCFDYQKLPLLLKIFETEQPQKVIIFSSSKAKVKELAKELRKHKYNVAEMHSDLEQDKREEVMLKFKAERINIIVATDIISRGIDIDNIQTVINYDVPREAEEYVHRIGRTARADKEGKGITLINEKEIRYFRAIEKLLEKEVTKISLPEGFEPGPDYKLDNVKRKRKRKPYNRNNKNHKYARKSTDKKINEDSPLKNTNRHHGKINSANKELNLQKQTSNG